MWSLASGLLGKLGLAGSLALVGAAVSGYFWWMWDIEKKNVIELQTSIGKMEVINVTSLATIKALEADNLHKDELHKGDVENIKTELGERDAKITELQEQNKFLFDRAVKKPFETGDAINARHYNWMCRLYYRKDCPGPADSGENTLSPASISDAEANTNANDNSNN